MNKEYCPHCGQSVSSHKHSLSNNMAGILKKAASIGPFDFHLQKDLNLTKNEYANFQKLKYWGLVEKADVSGCWRITSHGFGFLKDEIMMPRWVRTFNNRVIEQSFDLVGIRDLQQEPFRYKRIEEYAADSRPVFEESLF